MASPSSSPNRSFGQVGTLLLLVLLAALVLFCLMRIVTPLKERVNQPTVPTPVATSTVPSPATPKPTKPLPADDGGSTPSRPPTTTAATPVRPQPPLTLCDAQNFICVSTPVANALINNPTVVTGTAIAFENTFLWDLQDGLGNSIASGNAMADAPDIGQAGPFMIRAFWDTVPRTPTGTLIVYEASARDGSPIHTVRVPIRFAQRASMRRILYFAPANLNNKMDCSTVKGVEMTLPQSTLPIEATLRALLAVDSSDTPVDLMTSIPDRTQLVAISVAGGLAKATFDAGLERDGGGACHVASIRAQITKTLTQFASVERVDIAVVGKSPEETLQP